MTIKRNLLFIILIICVHISWDCCEGAQEEVDFHTIQLSSLFPSSSSCVLSSKVSASNTKSSLHVVNKHGPCSHLNSDKATTNPDYNDILRRDQARVDSIHSKISNRVTNRLKPSQWTELVTNHWDTVGTGTYVVKLGIGTPQHDLSLLFDTGSDLTWIQCDPCGRTCYSQKEPIFNPSSSSSYSNVSFSSPVCDSLTSAGISRDRSPSKCGYTINYGDKSSSSGFLAKERFTLTNYVYDVFDGINFGCGKNNTGDFYSVAGLLGLGRGELSFPSQTETNYHNIFSYCLPSSASYTGHLTFGPAAIASSVQFTPVSSFPDPSFYGVDIEGIIVGDEKLEIPLTVFSTPGAIIDSGTVITRLPPKAYEVLKRVFKEKMNRTTTLATENLDPCYDLTGFETVRVPNVSFLFSGGAVVELDPKGIWYPMKKSRVCFAFAANRNDREAAIFGSVQQKTMQVVYDGPGKQVGFGPNSCS